LTPVASAVRYGRGQRLLECASIALFALLAAWGLWRLALASGTWLPLVVLVAAPCGWAASDLLSGLLHYSLDTWGSVKTPVIGSAFIRPFREHHVEPGAMACHDFVETNGSSCFAALPLLAAAGSIPLDSMLPVLLQSVLLFIALGALATNQCHKWAHMDEAATPRLVRLAQRWRLVLPREQHRLHHTPPFDTHFCISCGLLNPVLDFFVKAFK